MNGSNGKHGSLYEQTLDFARREIDEASGQISKLREKLSYLEARMEAAKAVYEAVAARLNVEDEIGDAVPEETETRQAGSPSVVSREEITRLLHPQEPPPREPVSPPPSPAPSRDPGGLSAAEMDLIRRHLEAKHASSAQAAPEPPPTPARKTGQGGLSDEDRRLIEEHLRRRIEAERQNA